MAATQSKDVAFVVMLAGPGVPGSEILPAQTGKIALASGASKENAEQQVAIMKRMVNLVATEHGFRRSCTTARWRSRTSRSRS